MFFSTLNRITGSVRCVSSAEILLNAKSPEFIDTCGAKPWVWFLQPSDAGTLLNVYTNLL